MNTDQAKEILLLYRPGTRDEQDPQIAEALELGKRDPALGRWLKQQCVFHEAVRSRFQQIQPPAHLKAAILAQQKIIRPAIWWQNPFWLAAAAAFVALAGLAGLWLRPSSSPDRLSSFESRMVGTALRVYAMDLVTNDMRQVRRLMAAGGAPADYEVPKRLGKLELTGGGVLRWHNNPVSMVCFNRGDGQMLFLFVTARNAVSDPPTEMPESGQLKELGTASWSRGDKLYFLAGPGDVRKYL